MKATAKLEPAVETWLTGVESQSQCTAANYRQALERFMAVVQKPVSELTADDAARFVSDLNRSPLSPGSRAAYISAVRSFLRYCQEEGVLPKSPLHVLKRPRVDITSMNRYLPPEEAQKLLAVALPHERLAVALMLTTGLRVSEVTGAEWRHLFRDPEGRYGLLVHGKGGKSRVVGIPEPVWQLVKADRERRKLATELDDRDTSPLVAHRSSPQAKNRNATAFSRQGLLKLVREVTKRAKLGKAVSPHWLRHSYGTMAALADVPVWQIQKDMGHSRVDTSQRYVHWAKGLKDAGAYAVAGTLFGGRNAVRRRQPRHARVK
jgi:integrase/recombinase XerD